MLIKSRESSRLSYRLDSKEKQCYIYSIKCLPKQTGKELKSMIVHEVKTS